MRVTRGLISLMGLISKSNSRRFKTSKDGIGKAWASLVVSALGFSAALGFDYSGLENVLIAVGGPLVSMGATWLVPNRKLPS